MTRLQGWVLIGILIVVVSVWYQGVNANSMMGRTTANFQNAKADHLSVGDGMASCFNMCSSNYNDNSQEETCARECASAYHVSWGNGTSTFNFY